VPLRAGAGHAATLRRFAPSLRSLAVGVALLAIAVGAYLAARASSAFAVQAITITGISGSDRAEVRRAAAPLLGTSLLALDGRALERRLESLPTVVSIGYDRAFPHTLRIDVVPEVPVAVVRRGRDSWLVSARARVVTRVERTARRDLPRIWVRRKTPVGVGGYLPDDDGGSTARAVALASRFPAHVQTAVLAGGELTLRLRSGLELRLGAPTDVRLKLAIARRALRVLPPGSAYVDVSVPGRPVAGPNPPVSGGG